MLLFTIYLFIVTFFPGLGHYEINTLKGLFKLLWPVALYDLAKMLGFKSPNALTSCENATGTFIYFHYYINFMCY